MRFDSPISEELGVLAEKLYGESGANSLDWTPGNFGKGYRTPQGWRTWPVDQERFEPNHADAADHHGDDFRAPYLFLHPDGRVESYGEGGAHIPDLLRADPRLFLDTDSDDSDEEYSWE